MARRKKKSAGRMPLWLYVLIVVAIALVTYFRTSGEPEGGDPQPPAASAAAQQTPADETLTVRILDVGQGDSILLVCGDETMLIDGGPVEEGQFLVSRLNRLVTMFIDYAELMAEDEQLMSMQDWLNETDRFLTNNRRKVLDGKGRISREAATKKVGAIYNEFRKKQDAEYISEFDRQTEKYLKGE